MVLPRGQSVTGRTGSGEPALTGEAHGRGSRGGSPAPRAQRKSVEPAAEGVEGQTRVF